MLSEIDVAATLGQKLGLNVSPYRVLRIAAEVRGRLDRVLAALST